MRLWIAYDRDDAGNAASQKLGTELREAGMETWRVLLPKGMDVNEYARKVTPAEKSLGVLLQQAEWIGKGKRPTIAAPVEPVAVEDVKDVKPASSLAAIAAVDEPVAPAVAQVASEETPPAPVDEPEVRQTEGGELLFTFGERTWRVRGWQKNLGPEQMRVNAQVRRGDAYHVDTLDVYSANPFAEQLTFMDDRTRTRRDHMKYLTLIRAIALLHQYQRGHRTVTHRGETLEYIEVTKADIALANRIAHEVLGRTLDELPPQTRRLLTMLQAWVNVRCAATAQKPGEFRFTRRDVREATSWGDTQLKVHLARLVELEYVMAHRGLRGLTHEYELRYDGADDGNPHLMGLLDAQILDNDANRSGLNTDRSGSGRPPVGGWSVGGRGMETGREALQDKADRENAPECGAKAHIGEQQKAGECHRSDARIVEDAE